VWAAPDDALLAGLAAEDADAAVAFVRRFQGRVYGLALSIVGDPAAAEDVAQDAFTRAWRNAAAFDPRRGSVAGWLLTITRNLAIDALRLRRVEPVDPEVLAALHLPSPEVNPADHALIHDEVRRVAGAMAGLPVEQRRAVLLAALGGRTAREIGAVEDVPVGTAKTRIRSGMLKLRDALIRERDE
jgi:RNA polymerase sigma-70 factor (ECF subfamily)